jgi:hypothetical protein
MGYIEEFTHKDQIYYKLSAKAVAVFFSEMKSGRVQ